MKNLLISAGPTRESIDPVRFLSNRSTGKMGYALARAAVRRGFAVTLVSGPVALPRPDGLSEFVSVETAAEMAREIKGRFPRMDAAIMTAAVADFTIESVADAKIKKTGESLTLTLIPTEDILFSLGQVKRRDQVLVGFAAETNDLSQNAQAKLHKKNLNWIVANQVGRPDRGFAADTNAVTLFSANPPQSFPLELASKDFIADRILDIIFQGTAKGDRS